MLRLISIPIRAATRNIKHCPHRHRRHSRTEPRGQLGDCIQVTSHHRLYLQPRRDARTGCQAVPLRRFDAGSTIRSKVVYTDLYQAQPLLRHGRQRDRIEMKGRHRKAATSRATSIRACKTASITRWTGKELNHGLFTALRIRNSDELAACAYHRVAAFTVIATLIMVVLDKKKKLLCSKAMAQATARSCARPL